jgi:hypothetical protein
VPPEADRKRLARGLVAMSRAHAFGWVEAHYGAAVVASHYFRLDNALDERTTRALEANVDAFVASRPDRFPPADPGRGSADPARIVETLSPHAHELRSGGHDAIFSALALRALRDLPDHATPAVVDGVCRLLQVFFANRAPVRPSAWAREHPLPALGGPEDVATATLRATLRPWSHLAGVGTSGVIHWVTHAEALVSLEELGHRDVARRAYEAHALHLNPGPVEDTGRPPPAREPLDWLAPAYWEGDAPRRAMGGTWLAGHSFKLPYSLFRLLRSVDDPALREAALRRASLLLVPFE